MRMIYKLEDAVSFWGFLGVRFLQMKGDSVSAQSIHFQGHEDEVWLGLAKTFEKFAEMKSQLSAQRTLLEAANASPYG